MNLGFYPIASSSKGNCYLIKSETTAILLDAGITGIRIRKALKGIKLTMENIDGLLITHEHIDHMRSVGQIMKEAENCMLYCSDGTKEAIMPKCSKLQEERVITVSKNQIFTIGDIEVTAFELSHDAREPLAYSFKRNGKKITVVTDTGTLTEDIENAIDGSDILVIESNHEENILLYGRYPYTVKRRILSDVGHLSNVACAYGVSKYLKNYKGTKVPYVYLAHISQENNTYRQAMLTVGNILEENDFYVGKDLRMKFIPEEAADEFVMI